MAKTQFSYDQYRGSVHVDDFGAVGDGALTGAAQEGAGTGTDDSTAIQTALNYIRDNGGRLEFDGSKVYRCDSALTLLRNSNTGPTTYLIEFNGAALDFSNLASGDYFKVGADSLANIATDVGQIRLANGRIFGQQTGNPGSGTAATNTATTGIKLEYAYNVVLDHMIAHRCYIGLETYYAFPILELQGSYKRCIVGVYIDDVTNDSTFLRTEAAQCRFGMVAKPQGLQDSGKCVNNKFDGFRAEGCEVGVHLDPASNNAGIGVLRDWQFDNPYFASNTYDYIRAGTVCDVSSSSTRGADSTDRVYGLRVTGGNWGISPTATRAALAFSGNLNVRQASIDIPVDIDVANTLVGTPRWSQIRSVAQADATSDTFLEKFYDGGGIVYRIEGDNSETVTGTVTLAPAGVSIMDSTGGAVTATLADGTVRGQQKRIAFLGSTSSTISVTNHITSSPEVFTIGDATDYLILEWNGSDWYTIFNNGVTV